MNAACSRWRRKYPEKHQRQVQEWLERNADYRAVVCARRRAKAVGAVGDCDLEHWRQRKAFYGGRCWVPGCGGTQIEMDHVIALSHGGTNWPANIRPACKRHNSMKQDAPWQEFLKRVSSK